MVNNVDSNLGSLYVGLNLDTTDFNNSLRRSENQLSEMGSQGKSLGADFTRLNSVVKSIGKGFLTLGAVGLGTLTGLASISPAVSGAVAKMGVQMRKLSNIVGKVAKPIFDAIANDLLPELINFVEKNEGAFKRFFSGGATAIKDFSLILKGEPEKIKDLFDKTTTGLALGSAGFAIGGLPGALFGFGLGWALEGAEENTKTFNAKAIAKGEIDAIKNIKVNSTIAGFVVAGAKSGGLKGALVGFAIGSIVASATTKPQTENEAEDYLIDQTGQWGKTGIAGRNFIEDVKEGDWMGALSSGGQTVGGALTSLATSFNPIYQGFHMAINKGQVSKELSSLATGTWGTLTGESWQDRYNEEKRGEMISGALTPENYNNFLNNFLNDNANQENTSSDNFFTRQLETNRIINSRSIRFGSLEAQGRGD